MKILFKGKTYGLCRSCQTCEFYNTSSTWVWCELPFSEVRYFNNRQARLIKQNDIFKL